MMADFDDAIYAEGEEGDAVSTTSLDITTPDPVIIRGAGTTTLYVFFC